MATMLANLINPEVYGSFIEKKLTDYMVFAPLATVDTTLAGQPGSVIKVPAWSYIGDATVVSENSDITASTLTATSTSAEIYKLAKKVELTDEAVLSGLGDPIGESAMQVAHAIASGLDGKCLDTLGSISGTMLYETASSSTALVAADINKALEKFGEDVDGTKVAVVAPALATLLRETKDWMPASEIAAEIVVKGAIGMAYGCQIVVSNKLKTSGSAFIVKPGALRIFLKRDTLVETDRVIGVRTEIVATKHCVTYLYDSSKAVKLAKKS